MPDTTYLNTLLSALAILDTKAHALLLEAWVSEYPFVTGFAYVGDGIESDLPITLSPDTHQDELDLLVEETQDTLRDSI